MCNKGTWVHLQSLLRRTLLSAFLLLIPLPIAQSPVTKQEKLVADHSTGFCFSGPRHGARVHCWICRHYLRGVLLLQQERGGSRHGCQPVDHPKPRFLIGRRVGTERASELHMPLALIGMWHSKLLTDVLLSVGYEN